MARFVLNIHTLVVHRGFPEPSEGMAVVKPCLARARMHHRAGRVNGDDLASLYLDWIRPRKGMSLCQTCFTFDERQALHEEWRAEMLERTQTPAQVIS